MTDRPSIKQENKGDGGTNIVAEHFYEGDKITLAISNAANEMRSMMCVISALSNLSMESSGERQESEKDIDIKIKNFGEHAAILKKEYADLSILYGGVYNEAIKQNTVSELMAEKIANFLRRRSGEALENFNNNPREALSYITELILKYFEQHDKNEGELKYDEGAIRFYLFMELVKCNIFPNPLKNAD